MGLDTTHDCWHGAYSAFMRWRREIAQAAKYPPLDLMEGFYEVGSLIPRGASILADRGDEERARKAEAAGGFGMPESVFRNHWTLKALPISWDLFATDPLSKLLNHSDCDGEIAAADCGPIADRLEALLPALNGKGDYRDGASTRSFIDGLRRAAAAGENVGFH